MKITPKIKHALEAYQDAMFAFDKAANARQSLRRSDGRAAAIVGAYDRTFEGYERTLRALQDAIGRKL